MAWAHALSDIDFGPEEIEAVTDVVRSKWLSQGPKIAEFERRFGEFVEAPHAVALSSCTAALHLALAALDVGPGDEVLLPSYTFVATANAALYVGAQPVFVDVVGAHDLNLDPEDLKRKMSPRTKAIVVVHLAGFLCDMDRVMRIAGERGIPVVEDASHAIGAEFQGAPGSPYQGRRAGAIGEIGCFSFFANKNLPTGEGGMLVTSDEAIAQRVRLLRSHGMTRMSWEKAQALAMDYDVLALGYNYRCTEIAAAIGLVQLAKLPRNNAARRELVAAYRRRLATLPQVRLPFADRLEDSAHHILPVILSDAVLRTPLREALAARGIQTSVHYAPVHLFSNFVASCPGASLPITEDLSRRELTLPLHPLMTIDDVHSICDDVRDCLEQVTHNRRATNSEVPSTVEGA